MKDFVKAAPEEPQAMYDYIYQIAQSMKDRDLRELCLKLLTVNKDRLMYYPAAQINHHAELAAFVSYEADADDRGMRVQDLYKPQPGSGVCGGDRT